MADLRRSGVSIGPGAEVVRGTLLEPGTEIGAGTRIGRNCVFRGGPSISIGKFCDFGEGVNVHSANHEMNGANIHVVLQIETGAAPPLASKGPVRIGHSVWAGNNAIVLSGVTVGNGGVLGAGAVVTKDVPPFSVVAGSPARVIGRRFSDDVVDALEELAWWDWRLERIHASRALFELDLTAEGAGERLRQITGGRVAA